MNGPDAADHFTKLMKEASSIIGITQDFVEQVAELRILRTDRKSVV